MLRRVVVQLWRLLSSRRIGDVAAALTYYTLFALAPLTLFVVTLTLLVLPADVLQDGVAMLTQDLPRDVGGLIATQVERAARTASGGVALVSAGLAVWGASRGGAALANAFNRIHGVRETRPWWRRQLVAVGATVLVATAVVLALALSVVAPGIAEVAGLAWLDGLVSLGRYLVTPVVMVVLWGVLYRILPAAPREHRLISPGAVIGVAVWVAATNLFSFYVARFGTYAQTYGALGAVIAFFVWLWLSNMALLVGVGIDAAVAAARQEVTMSTTLVPTERPAPPAKSNGIGALGRRVGEDVSTLVRAHLDLAKVELRSSARTAGADAAAVLLGGIVGLVGLAMLCAAAVPGLAGLGWPLWLRMLVMAAVYIVIGTVVAGVFARRLRSAPPRLTTTRDEARRTAHAVSSVLREERHA